MIDDRIVVGLQDAALSEKLQMDKDLTLDKAVASARQREAVKKQQAVVRGEDGHPHVDTVRAKKQFQKGKPGGDRQWRSPGGDRRLPPQRPSPATMPTTCTRCGKSPHSRQQCPARDAICRKCSKKGHYQAVCRSKHSVGAVHAEREDVFIGTIQEQVPTVSAGGNLWIATVSLNGLPTEFKIDTGADVTVITEAAIDNFNGINLKSESRQVP